MVRAPALAAPPPPAVIAPRPDARHVVRSLLAGSRSFEQLHPVTQTSIAKSLAQIGSTALDFHDESAARQPLALAQNAGSEFSGTAVDRVAGTTQSIMNAVSFPRFVNELITGVFKAMNDSNQQQLTAFVDLIRNVAQTTEGFADANVGISGARSWLADHFPSFQLEGGEEVDMASELEGLDPAEARQRRSEIQAEQDTNTRLILRPGAPPPSEAALRSALSAPEGTALNPGNPEGLVPLAREVLARNRQQLLATMIQMGLQRIVVESGKVSAGMKLHVDASSAAENDKGSQFDMRNTTEVGVGAKFGPWGAEAKMQNTIGYVTTDRTSTTERLNAGVDLESGVEIVFRTDYVPLSRLAGVQEVERIRVNTLNPEAEAQRLTSQANARATTDQARDAAREHRFDSVFHAPPDAPQATINTRDLVGSAGAAAAPPPAAVRPPAAATPPVVTPPAATGSAVAPAAAVAPVAVVAPVAAVAPPAVGAATRTPAAPVPAPAAPHGSAAASSTTPPGTASTAAPAAPVASPSPGVGSQIGGAIAGDTGRTIGGLIDGIIAH